MRICHVTSGWKRLASKWPLLFLTTSRRRPTQGKYNNYGGVSGKSLDLATTIQLAFFLDLLIFSRLNLVRMDTDKATEESKESLEKIRRRFYDDILFPKLMVKGIRYRRLFSPPHWGKVFDESRFQVLFLVWDLPFKAFRSSLGWSHGTILESSPK